MGYNLGNTPLSSTSTIRVVPLPGQRLTDRAACTMLRRSRFSLALPAGQGANKPQQFER